MGEVTKEQRIHVIKELEEYEKILAEIYDALKDSKKLGAYELKDYHSLNNKGKYLFDKSQELAEFMNGLGNMEPPFNIFQGELALTGHGMPTGDFQGMAVGISKIKRTYFEGDRKRVEYPHLDKVGYRRLLNSIRYIRNCFLIFIKLASNQCRPETFKIKTVLEVVIKDRKMRQHHKEFVFNEHIENLAIRFDKAALYWITMRMLSNAEHATQEVPNAWIRMQTFKHKDGSFYLIVRNNGQSVEERALESLARGGGKSKPNIDKLCKDLDSEFRLKGFPDHTRACIRLPLAEEQGHRRN